MCHSSGFRQGQGLFLAIAMRVQARTLVLFDITSYHCQGQQGKGLFLPSEEKGPPSSVMEELTGTTGGFLCELFI